MLVVLCSGLCLCAAAQEDGGRQLRTHRKNPRVKTRVGISPVVSFYSTNKHHTSSPQQKLAFNGSIKAEVRLDRQNKSFLMFGAEYMMHGLNFNSYYFYYDSLHLYTGHMDYKYSLVMQELDFPLQLKYSFQKETNSIWSKYLFAGICYRWLVAGSLKVTGNGETLEDKAERVRFKNPAFTPVNNSFLCAGFGLQKNTMLKHNAFFAEMQFRYGLSPYYFNEPFAPSSLYISGSHLLVTVGLKF